MNDPDDPHGPAVEIALRVPGPWASPDAFAAALPEGYRLSGDGESLWLHTPPDAGGDDPDGDRVPLFVHPFDAEFVNVFAGGAQRLPSEADRAGIEAHAALVCPVFPGGSPRRAAAALRHTAALLRAGGFGVFVDNSGVAHGSDDWLDLAAAADDPDLGGPFYAFVCVFSAEDRVWSLGMHVLGERDATLTARTGDDRREDFALRNFLAFVLRSGATVGDGDRLNDETGAAGPLVVSLTGDDEVPPDHPMHNPIGRYRLDRAADPGPDSPLARGPA